MTSCSLYTGDGDFLPLVNALVDNGTFVTVASSNNPEKGEVTPELRNRADAYNRLDFGEVRGLFKDCPGKFTEAPPA